MRLHSSIGFLFFLQGHWLIDFSILGHSFRHVGSIDVVVLAAMLPGVDELALLQLSPRQLMHGSLWDDCPADVSGWNSFSADDLGITERILAVFSVAFQEFLHLVSWPQTLARVCESKSVLQSVCGSLRFACELDQRVGVAQCLSDQLSRDQWTYAEL